MPFEPNPVTTEDLVQYLTEHVGDEVGCKNIREASNQLKVSYATACKRLKSYKSGKGKWNLTAQEIERAYEAPSASSLEVNYIPEKDDSYVQFGNFSLFAKLSNLVSSIQSSSQVFLETAKQCPLSKRVQRPKES